MDLLPVIKEHLSSDNKVVFSGTDPGIVVTSTTVPSTLESIFASINRFQVLASAEESLDDEPLDTFDVKPLPKPYKITAGLINNVTFLKKHQQKHQHRQKHGVDKKIQQKRLAKEKREREIRTKKAYGKITAQKRRYICVYAQLPSDMSKPVLIYCIGHW